MRAGRHAVGRRRSLRASGRAGRGRGLRQLRLDQRALSRRGHQGQRTSAGFDAKAHAHQAVGGTRVGFGVEADAIVAHRYLHHAIVCGEMDPDVARVGVLADISDRFLHQA